jgi:Tol biopolymer transport system component
MRIASLVATSLALSVPAHAQVISRVSHDANGVEGNDHSGVEMVYEQRTVEFSADGNVVAFTSAASNLVPGDTNGLIDVFVFDRVAGTLERVSVDTAGAESDDDSYSPRLSSDGMVVAFWSRATNLVAGDSNGAADTFVRDRATGVTERVSVSTSGLQGNNGGYRAALSSDGSLVAFESDATNLIPSDLNHSTDIFVRDRVAGTTHRVSLTDSGGGADPGGCFNPDMSADGRYVVFSSRATNLVFGDTNGISDVFARDTVAKTTTRVSVDSNGAQADGGSTMPRISADGSTVAFLSYAHNLVAGDTNWAGDIFAHELASGLTERISVDSNGAESDGNSDSPALSADGSFVVFQSDATNLAANDLNGVQDVFLRDRAAGTTALLSVDYAGTPGNDRSSNPAISGDATQAAFASVASGLVANDNNGVCDVFLDDVLALQTPASWTNYGAGFPGTNGVPAFTASANPVLGAAISLDAGNSSGTWSVGLVLLGVQSASIPTRAGGTLLVDPLLYAFLPLTPSGGSLQGQVPRDPSLYGVSLFCQVLEIDAGAAHGISFSPGIQLIFGK